MSSISKEGLLSLAKQAGFNDRDAHIMAAIALAESHGETTAVNSANRNGTKDFGLWQINSSHGVVLSHGDWRNPLDNAKMAHEVWNMQGFTAWATYNSNEYKHYWFDPNNLPPGTTAFSMAKDGLGTKLGEIKAGIAKAADAITPDNINPSDAISAGFSNATNGLTTTLGHFASNAITVIIAMVLLVLGVLFLTHKTAGKALKAVPKVIPL